MHRSEVSQPSQLKSSGAIGTALATAVRLWLRSQLDGVEDLQVQIQARSRVAIAGRIPIVAVSASSAIYQGLYLRQISLLAKDIQVNLSQILKGQPLRLNEPVPVSGELLLLEADLNNSLKSPLLANALTEFLIVVVKKSQQPVGAGFTEPQTTTTDNLTKPAPFVDRRNQSINLANLLKEQKITWKQIELATTGVIINGICFDANGKQSNVTLQANLHVEQGHILQLDLIQIQLLGLPKIELDGFEIDLGSQVDIQELTLNSGQLICRGRTLVIP